MSNLAPSPRRRTRRPRRTPATWPPRRSRRTGCRRLLSALALGASTALIVFGVLLVALPVVTG